MYQDIKIYQDVSRYIKIIQDISESLTPSSQSIDIFDQLPIQDIKIFRYSDIKISRSMECISLTDHLLQTRYLDLRSQTLKRAAPCSLDQSHGTYYRYQDVKISRYQDIKI